MEDKPYFYKTYPKGEIDFLKKSNREIFFPPLCESFANAVSSQPKHILKDSLEMVHKETDLPYTSSLKVYTRGKNLVHHPMQAESSIPNSDSCANHSDPTSSPVLPNFSPKSIAFEPHIDPSTKANSK